MKFLKPVERLEVEAILQQFNYLNISTRDIINTFMTKEIKEIKKVNEKYFKLFLKGDTFVSNNFSSGLYFLFDEFDNEKEQYLNLLNFKPLVPFGSSRYDKIEVDSLSFFNVKPSTTTASSEDYTSRDFIFERSTLIMKDIRENFTLDTDKEYVPNILSPLEVYKITTIYDTTAYIIRVGYLTGFEMDIPIKVFNAFIKYLTVKERYINLAIFYLDSLYSETLTEKNYTIVKNKFKALINDGLVPISKLSKDRLVRTYGIDTDITDFINMSIINLCKVKSKNLKSEFSKYYDANRLTNFLLSGDKTKYSYENSVNNIKKYYNKDYSLLLELINSYGNSFGNLVQLLQFKSEYFERNIDDIVKAYINNYDNLDDKYRPLLEEIIINYLYNKNSIASGGFERIMYYYDNLSRQKLIGVLERLILESLTMWLPRNPHSAKKALRESSSFEKFMNDHIQYNIVIRKFLVNTKI